MTTSKVTKFVPPQPNDNDPTSNLMKFIRDLIGYEYYNSRAAFEHEGTEIAFVNEGLISRIHIYVDGEHKLSRFTCASTIKTNTSFMHDGREYQLRSHCAGWGLQSTQAISLNIDGVQVARKIDATVAELSWPQRLHFTVGAAVMGMVLGFGISWII